MIEENGRIYTATMAKLHADQGYIGKAMEIYEHLLNKEPGRQDFKDAMAELEKEDGSRRNAGSDELLRLFRVWVDLLLTNDKITRLKNVSSVQFAAGVFLC